MNYPLWDVPAPGLIIAAVAIVHVFISHFAVGGGLFLVLTELKARRERDAGLLDYVERHSRFFVLLTLVVGTMTGVGIWFTIGLVNPAAVSSLIAAFVWGWAIEWTFFVVEIAAALVYYYGWKTLSPRVHMIVGWIYFAAAWLSLAVINAILSFMLTPGAWLSTHSFWDGVLNPTYLPTVIARTSAAVGLAGLYAVLTATWLRDRELKARVARYAAHFWILPAAIVMPVALAWTLYAASRTGVPVAAILGVSAANAYSVSAVFDAVAAGSQAGQPIAQRALLAMVSASSLIVLLTFGLLARARSYGGAYAALMMTLGFVALGGAEFLREDLRKPYVIGQYMFVNGVRTAPAADRLSVAALRQNGVLTTAVWTRDTPAGASIGDEIARGREIFRLSCSMCHTRTGYLPIEPRVRGMSVSGAEGTIGRLAEWRGRRMPPFAGTNAERHDLAVYLASVGGMSEKALSGAASASVGARVFDENCSPCHGPGGPAQFKPQRRTAVEIYALVGRLPAVNNAMPPFTGSEAERHALTDYLAANVFTGQPTAGGVR